MSALKPCPFGYRVGCRDEALSRLLSAAPEMLEVLEDLVDILEKAAQSEMDDDGMSHVSYNVVCLARSKAYDVLRKARGSK